MSVIKQYILKDDRAVTALDYWLQIRNGKERPEFIDATLGQDVNTAGALWVFLDRYYVQVLSQQITTFHYIQYPPPNIVNYTADVLGQALYNRDLALFVDWKSMVQNVEQLDSTGVQISGVNLPLSEVLNVPVETAISNWQAAGVDLRFTIEWDPGFKYNDYNGGNNL